MTFPAPKTVKYSILIVDDIPETRLNLRKMLQFETQIEVAGLAANGAEGIEMATELEPDIVLMDVEMPKMDGITACEKIVEKRLRCKVIMMSVQDNPDYLRRSSLAGAKEFLVKPFSSDELVSCIRRVVSMGPLTRSGPTLTLPDKIRLFILSEQSDLLREALLTTPDIELVGVERNNTAALRQMIRVKPNVGLLEVVPGVDGLIISRSILRSTPQTRLILIVSDQAEADYLSQSRFAKDITMLVRPFADGILPHLIRQVNEVNGEVMSDE